MTLNELENSLKQRKQGLAYEIWRNGYMYAISIGSSLSKKVKFPRSPEEAFPELYPPKPTLKLSSLPQEVISKYLKRGGKR